MAAIQPNLSLATGSPLAQHKKRILKNPASVQAEGSSSSSQVAHTLTACARCRQRKTRCDPGLPRCGPCERTNSICEYYDSNKGQNVNRSYVVYLQHKVRELERELDKLENEDPAEDQEGMMRPGIVNMAEKESKFLGPSSGIAITRLVMQLAKQFTDATTIHQIVPVERQRQIKDLNAFETAKPTSKIYPLISDVAAVELPSTDLLNLLVTLYKMKTQIMYPALHEPSLDRDVDAVYNNPAAATHYQNFVVRMVIAISLQKLDTQYAGLADSYYLAALKYLEPCVKAMDMKSLQCFALMAEYSLLTPTRTAIFYIIGIAVRLVQALGYHEEKTITRPQPDGKIDYLEIDMRRRLFYCIMVMEFGLSHSLGRPSMLATSWDHIDVGWFETCDDKHITPDGIDPAAERPTLKKWIAIHFFKMRMLQLEIRRKLYLKKRLEPRSDADPWFIGMEARLDAWRDATPSMDQTFGIDRDWFISRYNTMVVFLFRPSPQVARPSAEAAMKCFNACEYNIRIQREQIRRKNIDLTWIFTQSLFMAINTMLWSLSYEEVRQNHSREAVEDYLHVAMDAISSASERWPGVSSAVALYQVLIDAVLKIYEKDGDVPISASTPSEINSPPAAFPDMGRSRTTSPATVASSSIATPPAAERTQAAPYGYYMQPRRSVEPVPYQPELGMNASPPPNPALHSSPPIASSSAYQSLNYNNSNGLDPSQNLFNLQQQQPSYFDPYTQFNPLPEFTPDLTIPGWSAAPNNPAPYQPSGPMQSTFNQFQQPLDPSAHPVFDPTHPSYPFPATSADAMIDMHAAHPYAIGMDGPYNNGAVESNGYGGGNWDMDAGVFGVGLTQVQQAELMQSLETDGMEDIQSLISATLRAVAPPPGGGKGVVGGQGSFSAQQVVRQ